ncbi:MAG: hypothetical protein K2J30_02945, partial [Clostridia bacterium]|nr:hypothetical protein [Clostridia bacterium]
TQAAGAETPDTPVDGAWKKVENASDLKAGDVIVLTYGDHAMGASSSKGDFRTQVSFNVANVSDEVVKITLEAADDGKFYLKVADGYLAAPTSKENKLYTKATKEEAGAWAITINEGVVTITPSNSADIENRTLLYNSNAGQERFACYKAPNATNKNVEIYVNTEEDA